MSTEKIIIKPNPDKILIQIPKFSWNSLFSKYVKDASGKEIELFIDIEEYTGFERRFQQNVSIGKVVAVGANVKGVLPGDMAIIDYIVTGTDDYTVGFVNGDRFVCIDAETTYHTENSVPNMNGMNTYNKGDFDEISLLYGIVRNKIVISRKPYVFLVHENPLKLQVGKTGTIYEEMEKTCIRTVLANNQSSICKQGDRVVVSESDITERIIDNHTLSVVFEQDLIAVL